MKNIKFLYILALAFVLGSCSDYFELDRPPQNPWNTVSEFERAAIGTYGAMFQGNGWQNPYASYIVVKVSMGDDVGWVSDEEWGYWRKTDEYNGYTEKSFRQYYTAIASANVALAFVEENDMNPYPTAQADDIEYNVKRIIGELYFCRALSYYFLETMFGHAYVPGGANDTPDIPLRTTYAGGVEEANSPHIGTTAEMYAQILSDLEKAVEMLPEEYVPGLMNESYQVRANKFAAIAMQARTYFMMGDYATAEAKCDILIDENGGRYDLTEDPIEAFNRSDISRGKEVIFYLPFFDTNLQSTWHMTVLNHNAGAWGQCNWCETPMTNSILNRIGWMTDSESDTTFLTAARIDKRFKQLYAVRYPAALAQPGQAKDARNEIKDITTVWNNKYFRGPKKFNTNLPLMRLAEFYLTRSICRFRQGDKGGAADDLNVVRERAWDTNVGGAYVPVTSANITEQMINDERLIEMFNENDRVDYLRALKVDVPNGDRGPGSVPYTSEDLVWKVPTSEALYNEAY